MKIIFCLKKSTQKSQFFRLKFCPFPVEVLEFFGTILQVFHVILDYSFWVSLKIRNWLLGTVQKCNFLLLMQFEDWFSYVFLFLKKIKF